MGSLPYTVHCPAAVLGPCLPIPKDRRRVLTYTDSSYFPHPRSETLPRSRRRRRSSCAPLKRETPWPCSRRSHPSGLWPRSECRIAQRPQQSHLSGHCQTFLLGPSHQLCHIKTGTKAQREPRTSQGLRRDLTLSISF